MLKRLLQAPIRLRLPILISAALIGFILTLSTTSYIHFRNEIAYKTSQTSQSIATRSGAAVERWIAQYAKELDEIASNVTTYNFLTQLAELNFEAGATSLDTLRQSYLTENPFPPGERQNLLAADSNSTYDALHGTFHQQFAKIIKRSNYYDLFLILPNGDVSYSVFKEDDFATNVQDGMYASSGLGEAYQRAVSAGPSEQVFVDFAPYAPSANVPASFLAQSMSDADGVVIGVLVIQLPIGSLKGELANISDIGPNDEVYLVGPDNLARSAATDPVLLDTLDPLPDLLHLAAPPEMRQGSFENATGINDKPVQAYVQPISIFGLTWSVVAELDRYDTQAPLRHYLQRAVFQVLGGVILAIIVGILIAKSITRPLVDLMTSMERMADEDYDSEINIINRRDDFGEIGLVLNSFREKLLMGKAVAEQAREVEHDQAQVVSTLGWGLNQLANGDLSAHISDPFSSEYEELRENFNSTLETMNALMRSIVDNSKEIHARAEEISISSGNLSQRTENQAATLEQTAAALDQLTTSVKEAADSACEVEGVVSEARKNAEDSGLVVSQAVEAVSRIRKSSTEISQIIGVIDDIAFQTNLLSLNAGVEAARAGEAGRGFAVVASEVRALAQRSSEAAKKIKTLIQSSSEHVETGVNLVGLTGDALGTIIEKVGNINNLVSNIASGSREQSAGLGEINIGMSQLDQVTQQNAAMVQEASAAASTLRNEATDLSGAVAKFRLNCTDERQPCPDLEIEFVSVSLPEVSETVPPVANEISKSMRAMTDGSSQAQSPSNSPNPTVTFPNAAEPEDRAANAGGWTDF